MRPEQIKKEVNQLELSEKLLLVEEIWDSIVISNSELPLSIWQQQELERRYQDYKAGKLGLHDWKSVHKKLRDQYK